MPQPLREEEGPFRVDQIHEGDRYELANGHPVYCMPASGQHSSQGGGGFELVDTDPVVDQAGVDPGYRIFRDKKNLRPPDVAVGNVPNRSGWIEGVPGLAIEYADTGQDEEDLQDKIVQLLQAGTRYIWVVRLTGPHRVEVYEPGKAMRIVDGDGELTAPGLLQNRYPVRAFFDREARHRLTLRNLLNREGYASLDAVKASGQAQTILTVLQARGLAVSEDVRARILACTDAQTLTRWAARAALAATAADALGA